MRLIERRIGLLFAGFLLCFLVIVGRAFWLQGVQGSKLASEAISQQTDVVTVPGLRGSVLDRQGNELAASEDAATIYATPYQVKKPLQTAEKLGRILGEGKDEVLKAITAHSGFSYVAHKVGVPTAARIDRLKLPGIGQLPDSRRTYPQGELAGQVIGAVGTEGQGLTGLEAGENSILQGTDGERHIVKDALGEPIRLDTITQASDGKSVQLTLDPAIQAKTEEVLAGVGSTFAPKGATAIVMDPRNSQILAMANWPPVNLNDLSEASPEDAGEPGDGLHLRAGLDLQGVHRLGRAGRRLVTPDTDLHPAAQHPSRRTDDRRRRAARDRNAERRRNPRPFLQRGRGDDRARGWAPRDSAAGSTASASAARPASSSPARSGGSCRR